MSCIALDLSGADLKYLPRLFRQFDAAADYRTIFAIRHKRFQFTFTHSCHRDCIQHYNRCHETASRKNSRRFWPIRRIDYFATMPIARSCPHGFMHFCPNICGSHHILLGRLQVILPIVKLMQVACFSHSKSLSPIPRLCRIES